MLKNYFCLILLKYLYRELIYSETNSDPVSNRMSECLKPDLLPQQQLANKALKMVGNILGISEIKDCDSAANYVNEKLKMILSKVCPSSVNEMLEILPGDEEKKDKENEGKEKKEEAKGKEKEEEEIMRRKQ